MEGVPYSQQPNAVFCDAVTEFATVFLEPMSMAHINYGTGTVLSITTQR